ncbi:unnamed protein product [Sphagnum tenellum]
MDKEQQRAATKKGGQQPRGGVIKNVIAEVKEDVVKTMAYVWQGSSNDHGSAAAAASKQRSSAPSTKKSCPPPTSRRAINLCGSGR